MDLKKTMNFLKKAFYKGMNYLFATASQSLQSQLKTLEEEEKKLQADGSEEARLQLEKIQEAKLRIKEKYR